MYNKHDQFALVRSLVKSAAAPEQTTTIQNVYLSRFECQHNLTS
jgi:hypothetical protein